MFRRPLLALSKNSAKLRLKQNCQTVARNYTLLNAQNKYRIEFLKLLKPEIPGNESNISVFYNRILPEMGVFDRGMMLLELILKECENTKMDEQHPYAQEFEKIKLTCWNLDSVIFAYEMVVGILRARELGIVMPSKYLDELLDHLSTMIKLSLIDLAQQGVLEHRGLLSMLFVLGQFSFQLDGDPQVKKFLDEIVEVEREHVLEEIRFDSIELASPENPTVRYIHLQTIPKIVSVLTVFQNFGLFEKERELLESKMMRVLPQLTAEGQIQLITRTFVSIFDWSAEFTLEVEKRLAYTLEVQKNDIDLDALLRCLATIDSKFRGKFAFKVREIIQAQLQRLSPKTCLLVLGYLNRHNLNDQDLIDFCEEKVKKNAKSIAKTGECAVILSSLVAESELVSLEFKELTREWLKDFEWREFSEPTLLKFHLNRMADRQYKDAGLITDHLKSSNLFLFEETAKDFLHKADSLWNRGVIDHQDVKKYFEPLFDKLIGLFDMPEYTEPEIREHFLSIITQMTDKYDKLNFS